MKFSGLWLTFVATLVACGDNPLIDNPPVVGDQQITVAEDTSVSIDVGAVDPEGSHVQVTFTAPAHGTIVQDEQRLTYTPAPDYHGPDAIVVTARHVYSSATATISITVTSVNDAPVALTDTRAGAEDTAATVETATLTANDRDLDGDTLTVTAVGAATHGTVALAAGVVTFTPEADFVGTGTFEYTVSDGTATATGLVAVAVGGLNDAPVATDDVFTTAEDNAVTITAASLTGNDTDIEGQSLSVAEVTAATHGTVALVGGVVTFTPALDFHGDAGFDYTVSDGGDSDAGHVTVTVAAVNDLPIVAVATASTNEDTAVTLTLSGSDVDGTPLTFAVVAGPSAGTLGEITQLTPTSASVVYTPAANSHVDDSFSFRANDGTADSATAIATVTVASVNDSPTASGAVLALNEDATADVALAGADLDGDSLSFAIVTGPAHGALGSVTTPTSTTARVTYTPAANYQGPDSFTFTVNDGTATSALATAVITVNPINDAPVANDGTVTTSEDATFTFTISGSDLDSATLNLLLDTNPSHGTIIDVARATPTSYDITYAPAPDYNGDDSFVFHASDGSLSSAVATVTIHVTAVNDPPIATAGAVITNEDTDAVITLVGTDVDGNPLSFSIVTSPATGTLGGITSTSSTTATVTYTPPANGTTDASFTFRVRDGNLDSAPVTVTIDVVPVNDAPVATAAASSTDEDTAVTVTFAGTDLDAGATLTAAIESGPSHGTLGSLTRASATSFTALYTPAANYFGADTINFHVDDSTVSSAVAAVTLTIASVNDAPIASAGTSVVDEDGSVDTLLSGLDNDGTQLTFTIVIPPTHGTLGTTVVDGLNTAHVPYVATANYNGPDSYTFTVSDGTATSASSTHSITVNPINDAPVATAATVTTNEDTAVTVTFAGTDLDAGATLTAAIESGPSHGTLGSLTRASATSFTALYTPATNYNGSDSISFHVNDGTANSPTQAVTVTIAAVNDAPTASVGSSTVSEDVGGDTLMSGADVENSALTFTIVTPPAHGTLGTISSLGPSLARVAYSPAANYNGPDSYTFTVGDGVATSAAVTNTITVSPVNDAPTAVGGNASTSPGTPVVLTLQGADLEADALTFTVATGPASGSLGAISQVTPTSASVTYTPAPGSSANATFTFRSNDGNVFSAPATFSVVVTAVCADGWVDELEACDDGGTSDGDGCSAGCTVETGWACAGSPSACDAVCGDGILVAGEEACDDGNLVNTDGCTSQCVIGQVCSTANPRIGGFGNQFTVDPATGHCYVGVNFSSETWHFASNQCGGFGGYLATVADAAEQALVSSVRDTTRSPWIGASDLAVEGTLAWQKIGEPFTYTNFASNQPDHTAAAPHCVQYLSGASGQWRAVSCNDTSGLGRICELDPPATTCGNGAIETALGEQCDDGNTDDGDGCTATCQHQVFISEYIEGSLDSGLGQIDAIELYNPSSSRVILPSLCLLQAFANGATSGNQSVLGQNDPNERTIEAHGTLVLCTLIGPAGPYQTVCNTGIAPGTLHKSYAFNGLQALTGNDFFALKCGTVSGQLGTTGAYVDVIGILGDNPGTAWGSGAVTTSNHTLRRKCGLQQPRTDPLAPWDPTLEWDSFPVDDISDLGNYDCP